MDAAAHPSQDLRVRKLTLFSHGVANLELSTEVEDDATLHLSFPERHMNDVLKTLTVVDKNDGTIASISYEAPSDRRALTEDTLRLDRNSPLKTLLESAQGALVTLRLRHRDPVIGTLLGLQWLPSTSSTGDNSLTSNQTLNVVLLQENMRVSSHNMTELLSLEFHDEQLQRLLHRRMRVALTTLRSKNNKSVTITAKGDGKRTVVINYAVESPVPKQTYRFLLPSSLEKQTETGVFVQGWAIVDNPSDEDLVDIDVTIVSGLPISFRHDLYGARYVERPEEEVPTASGPGYAKPSNATFGRGRGRSRTIRAAHPRTAAADAVMPAIMAMPPPATGGVGPQTRSIGAGGGPQTGSTLVGFGGAARAVEDDNDLTGRMRSAPPAAETDELGDLFEYNIPVKVTIKGQESALVPLIMQQCEGGRVDVYSHKVRPTNTLSAVRIKNTTDATFEGGPVSVYDGSRLVGEGMMSACRPNSEQFLPYSVDLDCLVQRTTSELSGEVVSTFAVGGYFKVTRHRESIKVYEFTNNKPDDIDLYVLHEKEKLFALGKAGLLVAPRPCEAQGSMDTNRADVVELKPIDIREGIARYRFTIPAGNIATLEVRDTRDKLSKHSIRKSCSTSDIVILQRDGAISKKTAEKMKEILGLEAQIANLRREQKSIMGLTSKEESSQQRYRENLRSLGGLQDSQRFRDDPLIEKFLKSLAGSEEQIEVLTRKAHAVSENLEKLEAQVLQKVVNGFGNGQLQEM